MGNDGSRTNKHRRKINNKNIRRYAQGGYTQGRNTRTDCTANDGTPGVSLWEGLGGGCYSIPNTEYIDLDPMVFGGHDPLTGPIPAEIGLLTNLAVLDLRNNELSGPIPPEIGNLTRLEVLQMMSNQLIGPIPSEIGNLTKMALLSLSDNQLSGPIPSSIGNVGSMMDGSATTDNPGVPDYGWSSVAGGLWQLGLWGNQLTGEIPPEIGQLTNLIWLGLTDNLLSGPIPSEICNVGTSPAAATWLEGRHPANLTNNQLCPPWPDCLSFEDDIVYQNCVGGEWSHDHYLEMAEYFGCPPGCKSFKRPGNQPL